MDFYPYQVRIKSENGDPMHKTADTAQSRLSKICEHLTEDVLVKAHEKGAFLIEEAQAKADAIIAAAEQKAKDKLADCETQLEAKRKNFESSMRLALEKMRADMEYRLVHSIFKDHLYPAFQKALSLDDLMVHAIKELLGAFGSCRHHSDLQVTIHEKLSLDRIANALAASAFAKDGRYEIKTTDRELGIVLCFKKEHLTVELTQESLKALLSPYLQDELRRLFFKED